MSGPTLTLVAEEPSSASKYPEADEDAPSGSAKTRVSLPAAQSNPFMASAEETAELFNSIDQDLDLAEASSQPQQHPEAESESESEDDRDEEEIEGVAWEMRQLEHKFEGLKEAYQLVDRLGEGTFSSVYKAIDTHHYQYDNKLWCRTCRDPVQLPTPDPSSSNGPRAFNARSKRKRTDRDDDEEGSNTSSDPAGPPPPSKHAPGKQVYVALKRIYVTSSPQRILNELDLLHLLKGNDCIAHLITAFRHQDQVLAVMPYERHQDFRMYYRTMSIDTLRHYLRCLFSALEHTHSRGILHRDVKPANFLFNPSKNHGTLCDFGLAEPFNPSEWQGRCLHSLPSSQMGFPHGKLLPRPKGVWQQVQDWHNKWLGLSDEEKASMNAKTPWLPMFDYEEGELIDKDEAAADFYNAWEPVNLDRPKKASRVGYLKPEQEKRPQIRANRAGTRGFRAPEVLLKCPDQTVSIDLWSVGIIILCIVTRRFPFFHSNDDVEALMEIGTIFGKKKMEICAALHNRTFNTNVPSVVDPEFSTLHQLVFSLNPAIFDENRPESASQQETQSLTWYTASQPLFQVVDLMRKCLALDCTRRITALDALKHPFFQEHTS